MFSPLLKSVDLDISTTMLDLYNYNGIEIHIFVTELNKYELVDISYKTHPDWRIIDAIHSSCCIPVIFSPIVKDGCCYIDGGFLLNYPISKCLETLENMENIDEILGISLTNYKIEENKEMIHEKSNVIDVLSSVVYKTLNNTGVHSKNKNPNVPYQIYEYAQPVSLDYAFAVLYNKEERQKLIDIGIDKLNQSMEKWFSQIIHS
jgi:predicted acylesterase/phospholipase RssA